MNKIFDATFLRLTVLVAVCLTGSASAQDNCLDTPRGQVCTIQQPLVSGAVVGTSLERTLGLVTVNGGCSGTMLNRYWLLTARHCVTTDARVSSALLRPDQVSVMATWAPGLQPQAVRIHDLQPNVGVRPDRDIVLVYFGSGDLGDTPRQPVLISQQQVTAVPRWEALRLKTTDNVTQYGRGFSTYAVPGVGGVPPTPAQGIGTYRSGNFRPSAISQTHYDLQMNAANQVGHGGDSGGPTWLISNGMHRGIAGVQSTCRSTGTVAGAPNTFNWRWVTGISLCTYVSVEPMIREIGQTIQESPECKQGSACHMPVIVHYVLGD